METLKVKSLKNKFQSETFIDYSGKKRAYSITYREVKRLGFNNVIGMKYQNNGNQGTCYNWIFE